MILLILNIMFILLKMFEYEIVICIFYIKSILQVLETFFLHNHNLKHNFEKLVILYQLL